MLDDIVRGRTPPKGFQGAAQMVPVTSVGVSGSVEFANPASGTLSSILFPTRVSNVQVELVNLGATNLDAVYVVFDAYSAADATAKLGLAATREIVPLGALRECAFVAPIARLDLVSNEATPSGAAVAKVTWGS